MTKKGSVLMISLWLLAILVLFALGLGHRAMINLRLAKYQRDRLKATCLAKAGINRAIAELEKDARGNTYDSLNEAWNTGKDTDNNNIFENIEISGKPSETFTVSVKDEERKININRIDIVGEKQILEIFLSDKIEPKLDPTEAQNLTNTIINWIDTDSDSIGESIEDNEIFKNVPLKTSEELLLILEYFYKDKDKKKVKEIYDAVKDLITVYRDETGKINLNTVSEETFKILGLTAVLELKKVPGSNVSETDVDTLVANLRSLREKNEYFLPSEINIESIRTRLGSDDNGTEIIGQLVTFNILIAISKNFRIESQGKVGNITKNITVIYDRQNDKVVYWHEN